MAYAYEMDVERKSRINTFTIGIFFTAILLHQSSIVFGINISFADIFCLLLLTLLVINNRMLIPIGPLLFFFIVSILVLTTANFYIPMKYTSTSNPVRIISDYTKLLATFIYFLLGYNLANLNLLKTAIKWYSVFGILIGAAGVLLTILKINVLTSLLFFGDTRFKGLMTDPNYFSVLQVTALVYLSRLETVRMRYKIMAFFVTLLSVVVSGSKTGIITFICYFIFRTIEYLFTKKIKVKLLIFQLFFMGIVLLIAPVVINLLLTNLSNIASAIPSFSRVYLLFTDFGSAVSEGGSGREITWKGAFQIIQLSPLIGIGVGTYTTVAWEMFQYSSLAHNTFLQISAEWGIPLAVFFFSYIFILLGKATNLHIHNSETNLILRDIILILLIGSMAISLNNARMLWLFLGGLMYLMKHRRGERAAES